MAANTGVPVAAWRSVAPVWAGAIELRSLRAGGANWNDPPVNSVFAFAERAGDGRIVGLSLRAEDGRKGAPAGAKRGLIVPATLHASSGPVLVVEGASDVAACCAMALAAVGRPSNRAGAEHVAVLLDGRQMLIFGENDGKPSGACPGRDGAKHVAQQVAQRLNEPSNWALPPAEAKDIRAWLQRKIAAGLNTQDDVAMKAAGAELLEHLAANVRQVKPAKRTAADMIVDLACERFDFGITPEREPFAVERDGPAIALMLRGNSSALRARLARVYRDLTGRAPPNQALADALLTVEGMCGDQDPQPVALRVAQLEDGTIILDVGDATGQVIRIDRDGWRVEARSPVLFRRTALTNPFPLPREADPADLAQLRQLLNVDDESWPVLVSYLVAAFFPGIPHAALMLGGEQGTGKSTAARLLTELIDPSPAPLRTEPRDPEDWAVMLSGGWMVVLDNVSHIPLWLSDAICKACTGDGFVRRKRYTDSELAVLSHRRVIAMTSIDTGALRGDLGDRLLIVVLAPIGDERRRTEAEVLNAFKSLRPQLLGALITATSRTLAALDDVRLDRMPRMADFAKILAALDRACPELTSREALDVFLGQREQIAQDVVESDLVAEAVVRLVAANGSAWCGTSQQLHGTLTPIVSNGLQCAPKEWPKGARGLSGKLRRVVPALRHLGIEVDIPTRRSNKGRKITIRRIEGSVQTEDSGQCVSYLSLLPASGLPSAPSGTAAVADVTVGDGSSSPIVTHSPSVRTNGSSASDGSDGPQPLPSENDALDDYERLEREGIEAETSSHSGIRE